MLLVYARLMWARGHYQFFPLLMAVSLWLLHGRISSTKNEGGQPRLTIGLLCGDLMLVAAATVLYSSLLAFLSFLFLVTITVYDKFGSKGLLAGLPAILLMVFIIPLPGNFDQQLILKLQFLASQLASWVLDAFGQIHFREGVVLITEKKQFFNEEACSGIRSLFSSLAAIAAYGVIRHYSPWRQLFNLCQTVVWVILGNAIRIAIVVFVSDNWTTQIATGTSHEMFGLLIFWLIILLAVCTDLTIDMFKRGKRASDGDDIIELSATPIRPPGRPANPLVIYGLTCAFVLVCLFSARLYYMRNFLNQIVQIDSSELIPVAVQDLPNTINGWTVASFDYHARNEASLLAPESYIWTLSKQNKRVTISLDGPYPEYHNLESCYSGLGWKTSYRDEYSDESSSALDGTIVNIEKSDEHGIVLFSAYDRFGKLIVPLQGSFSLKRRGSDTVRNLKLAFGLSDSEVAGSQLPISQIQLLYVTSQEITEDDLADLRQLFVTVRKQLLRTARFNLAVAAK